MRLIFRGWGFLPLPHKTVKHSTKEGPDAPGVPNPRGTTYVAALSPPHHVDDVLDGRPLNIGAEGSPGVPRAGGRRCPAMDVTAAEVKGTPTVEFLSGMPPRAGGRNMSSEPFVRSSSGAGPSGEAT